MYGWRGRIGWILPADNAVVEVDIASRLPMGISSHSVRLSSGDQRDKMPVEGVQFARFLTEADVDVVGYMCAASSYLLGVEGNKRLCADLSASTDGLPAFTASTAMTDALAAMDAKKISVLTPHPEHIAEHLRKYLESAGFSIADFAALNLTLREINSKYPGDVYRYVKKNLSVDSDADAIFIAATNFRAMEIIDLIEQEYGVPVITSNQVSLWAALRALGQKDQLPGLGHLFQL